MNIFNEKQNFTNLFLLLLLELCVLASAVYYLGSREYPASSSVRRADTNTLPIATNPSDGNVNNKPMFCGGIAGVACPEGYECGYEGTHPDASGICIKEIVRERIMKPNYVCPENGWVDCMPTVVGDTDRVTRCTKEALAWYFANCPNYEGVAY